MRKIYTACLLLLISFGAKAQFPAPYCAEAFSTGVEPITNVKFAGIDNTSPATLGGAQHQDFTAITGTVQQGSPYLIEVQGNTDGNFTSYVRLFADWNRDNDFLDASESYDIGTFANSTGTDGIKVSATIVVPAGALTGSTRIRVSKKFGSPYPAPCNTSGYGQAEDYTLTVTAGAACSGTPAGGGVSPASTIICASSAVTLTSTAANTGTGYTFQWQSSPAGTNSFTNIAGATSNTYTTTVSASTDFRVIITCGTSSLSGTSSIATVTLSGPPANDAICNAIVLTLDGVSNCQNTTCATAVNDSAFSNSTPNNTVWYTYTPTVTGRARVKFKRPTSLTTGLLNGWLGIYTATGTCPSLVTTELKPTNLSFNLTTADSVSLNTPTLTAGTTYYFLIDGVAGAFGSFCIQVITPPTPPPCTTNITPANGATNVPNPVTFNWTPVAGATGYEIRVSTDGGTTYPLSLVVTAPPVSNVGGLAYSTTYRWYVRPINGLDTASTSCAAANSTTFTTQAAPPPPANDNCSAAIALSPYSGPVNGTTVSATQSSAPAVCVGGTSTTAYDVWYSVRTLSNGSFTITLTGNGTFDAALGIYRGTCASLTFDTCRDATGSGGAESITVNNAVAGTTYLIRVYDYSGTPVSDSVGTFSISASGVALPVTGIVLSGIRNGSKAQLSWKTLTEINNAGFELQRSVDGRHFTGIANVASKANGGNSTAAINYNVDDVKPFSGANYYRLKQTDKDGKTSFSNIVYLKGVAVSNLTLSALYPNPTKDVLKASVQAPAAENITFVITDMMGKAISRQVSNVISGDNTINLNVANLPSGSYLLKAICRNGCETVYQKFTKQ